MNSPPIFVALGCGFSLEFLIRGVQQLGLACIAVEQNMDPAAKALADHFFEIPTDDYDSIYKAIKPYSPIGIATIGSDKPLPTIFQLNQAFQLRGLTHTAAYASYRKDIMHGQFEKHHVSTPKTRIASTLVETIDAAERLEYPIVIKPIERSGGVGISKVESLEQLPYAIEKVQKSSQFSHWLVQKYVHGRHTCVEIFAENGCLHPIAVIDRDILESSSLIESRHVFPSRLHHKGLEQCVQVALQAARAIDLQDGICHVDMIFANGKAYVSEIGARIDGGLKISHLLSCTVGVDLIKSYVSQLVGRPYSILVIPQGKIGIISVLFSKAGRVRNIVGLEKVKRLKQVKYIRITKKTGDYIPSISSLFDSAGHVVIIADTFEEAEEVESVVHTAILFEMERDIIAR